MEICMPDTKIDVAFWDYDRTRPLVSGKVSFAGVDATFHSAPIVPIIFEGMVHGKFENLCERRVTVRGDSHFFESLFPPLGDLYQ
jgi:4,5-dihydroxyphthalate decarboxylase